MAHSRHRVRTIGSARAYSYKWCVCRTCGHSPLYKKYAKQYRNRAVRRDMTLHIILERG